MKRYRSDEEWRKLIAEQKRSGKSVKQFCQVEGVHSNMFYRKKKSLREGGGLVRLAVGITSKAPIEISVGDVKIGMAGGFEEKELVRVLRCVKEAFDAKVS